MGTATLHLGQSTKSEPVRTARWLRAFGVLLIATGIVAIAVPAAASVTVAVLVGWIFAVAGLFQFGSAFTLRSAERILARALLGVVSVAVGLYLISAPLDGTITLTIAMGIYFLAAGVINFAGGVASHGTRRATGLIITGVVSLLIGIIVLAELPGSAAWAIGLVVGVNFMFEGLMMLMMGSAIRSNSR